MGSRNAKRVKNINGMEQIGIDLKPRRSDSFVYSHNYLDITTLSKYIEKKKKDNPNITYFHAFVTALGKVFYNRNKLNRFVQNRHIFEHNDIVISFVAKVSFDDYAEEIMIMVPISPDSTIDSISAYIKGKLDAIRKKDVKKEGANNAIDILSKFPNFIRVPLIGALKWCDDKGILPSSLTKDNLYYSSMIVSNLGTLGNNAIHHNISNFGTCSSLATIGEIKDDGKKKIVDWGVAFDERVADGFYLIRSVQLLQYVFDHPELLDERIDSKIEIEK